MFLNKGKDNRWFNVKLMDTIERDDTTIVFLSFFFSLILSKCYHKERDTIGCKNLNNMSHKISSVESQKGINAAQRCSVDNHKGVIAVQSLW